MAAQREGESVSAGEKRMSAAERASSRIAALSSTEVASTTAPVTPRVSRDESERGVLGRFDRVMGNKARVERLELDPARVRVWRLQGRLQDALTPEHVADVVASIREYGQFVPAIARPINDDPKYSHEVIEGSRRRLACEILGRKLVVYSSDLTDLQAAMISQSADDQVKHSPYEVGLRWQGWLAAGIAKGAGELAEKIGVSPGLMSLRLNVAQVPRAFLRCFGDHDRVPKAIYLRLASLVVKARQTARLPEVTAELNAQAEVLLAQAGGPRGAIAVLSTIENSFRRRREQVTLNPVERRGLDDRRVLTVTPGRNQVGIKLARPIAEKQQVAFAEAVADFASSWISEHLDGAE
jgi:ParB/RepB/Spo0J family partition protein